MNHALKRAGERLLFIPNLKTVIHTIKAGDARFVGRGRGNRLIYDVPYGGITVRALVDEKKTFVISILPLEFRKDAKARKRREFFKHFVANDDDSVQYGYEPNGEHHEQSDAHTHARRY